MKTKEEPKLTNEDIARNTWDSWISVLEEGDQPETCNIDDSDCEACGS
tara:strand:+ start:274 stop:417 length:144 start_codon:yes stop_codon:yes gene_type:complete